MPLTLAEFTADTFRHYLGATFVFQPPLGTTHLKTTELEPAHLELIEVNCRSSTEQAAGLRRPFSLLFEVRGRPPLGRGLYWLTHDDFEPCELFLSRVSIPGRDVEAMYYEAVFA